MAAEPALQVSSGPDFWGYGGEAPTPPWAAEARAVVSIGIHLNEGAELAVTDGDPMGEQHSEGMLVEQGHQEFAIEYFFEYGARCGVWRLLRMLQTFGVSATFFCSGRALERNPALGRRIVELGHEIACQGWRYIPYYDLSVDEQRREIDRGREAIRKHCGVEPIGWASRIPTPETRGLVVEAGGFIYDCDGYGDDFPYWVKAGETPLLVVPNTFDNSDEKFWALPNNSGFTNPANLLNSMKDSLDWLVGDRMGGGRILPVSLRPRIAGRPSKAEQVFQFLTYAKAQPGVAFMTRGEIARRWIGGGL